MDTTGTGLLPIGGSSISGEVDALFNFVFFASLFFFLLVTIGVIFFVIKYRRRVEKEYRVRASHNTKLEIIWTIIPFILVLIVFFWGFKIFLKMQIIPANAMEVKVTAQKWFWTFDYPDGMTSVNELVVPLDKPIKLTMSSTDVIHSFFVPGFRIKMDVLPNRYTLTWFEATRKGEYDLFCAEYCGTGHSEMIGKVKVLSEREYNNWVENNKVPGEDAPLKTVGEKLYQNKACVTCHSIDGRPGIGPSLKGRYGTSVELQDGSNVQMDENYIRESILKPQAKVTTGYQAVMPTYQGLLNDRQIDGLVEYIKSLNE